jgi:hypothetical protein
MHKVRIVRGRTVTGGVARNFGFDDPICLEAYISKSVGG